MTTEKAMKSAWPPYSSGKCRTEAQGLLAQSAHLTRNRPGGALHGGHAGNRVGRGPAFFFRKRGKEYRETEKQMHNETDT